MFHNFVNHILKRLCKEVNKIFIVKIEIKQKNTKKVTNPIPNI